MKVSSSKSEPMVLNWKTVECFSRFQFKYLGILFMSDGRLEREMDRQIGASSAVMRELLWSVLVKNI